MTEFVIAQPPVAAVPVQGGGLFPVRRIFCIGQNYADHVREMGGDPAEQLPIYFTKPADAVVTGGQDTPYPGETANLHFEIELVIAIGTGGREIEKDKALDHIYGYAVGIDLTRRDLQSVAKKAGQPWDMAKGFDHSAPIGDVVPVAVSGHPARGSITLEVNGETRQSSDLAELIWSVPAIIANLSTLVDLAPGDLIFTGTPSGVGAVIAGGKLVGAVEGVGSVATAIVAR